MSQTDSHNSNLPAHEDQNVQVEQGVGALALGQWVMVADEDKTWNGNTQSYDVIPTQWLGCIMDLGSNYVLVGAPSEYGRGRYETRLHFNEVWSRLTFLTPDDARARIEKNVAYHQAETKRLIDEVQAVTQRLGLQSATALPGASATQSGTALAVLSGQVDVDGYKTALVAAKEKVLPELFEAIKKSTRQLSIWMSAETLPMQALAGDMKDHVAGIQDRIFNISLYAGLVESLEKVCDGQPAAMPEKLHIMQRRCYMDEECLANYEAGGMSFKHISEFDAWLARPENRDRILPFQRTIVAMQVRRKVAERDWDGSIDGAFVNFQLAQQDKLTFLYIRNGEQLWRLSTEIDFGSMIFPDKAIYNPLEPKMVKMFGERVDKIVSLAEYEAMRAEQAEWERKAQTWRDENPKEQWLAEHPNHDERYWRNYASPYSHRTGSLSSFSPREWQPLDESNLYFDEAMEIIGAEIKRYNRIAMIIQGVFDRSEALHPHAPVKTWTPAGFQAAIELVYDGSNVLDNGEAPSFEAYRDKCNKQMGPGSVVVGQYNYWLTVEAQKEMARRQKDWRMSEGERYRTIKRFKPSGNPGPLPIARLNNGDIKGKKVLFTWGKERTRYPYTEVACKLSVPKADLFNISAYRPGDFKQFYQDHRTRAQYLQWAPLLLAAEDWWAQHNANKEIS